MRQNEKQISKLNDFLKTQYGGKLQVVEDINISDYIKEKGEETKQKKIAEKEFEKTLKNSDLPKQKSEREKKIDFIQSNVGGKGIFEKGGVYANYNIYRRYDRDKIEKIITEELGNDTLVDFSRQSEATYISIPDGDDEITIRIGSHFKSGTSGYADIYLDYRDYLTIREFRKDLKFIKEQSDKIIKNNDKEQASDLFGIKLL